MSSKQPPPPPTREERIISRALALMAAGKARGWSDALSKASKTV